MELLFKILRTILNKRLKGSITIHFDGKGGFVPETNLKLKGDEVYKLLTNKTE